MVMHHALDVITGFVDSPMDDRSGFIGAVAIVTDHISVLIHLDEVGCGDLVGMETKRIDEYVLWFARHPRGVVIVDAVSQTLQVQETVQRGQIFSDLPFFGTDRVHQRDGGAHGLFAPAVVACIMLRRRVGQLCSNQEKRRIRPCIISYNNNNKIIRATMIRRITITIAALLLSNITHAEDFRFGGGPTEEGSYLAELGLIKGRWDLSLGYVGAQDLGAMRVLRDCGEGCVRRVPAIKHLDSYVYLSAQRVFEFMPDRTIRPFAGIGLVAQSETNWLVSSPVNFSLSAGLGIGERLTLQWRHFSNGDTRGPNMGQDALVISWSFKAGNPSPSRRVVAQSDGA